MDGVPLSATTVDENVQRGRAARPLSKIHGRKIIQKKLLGEIPAKDHSRDRNEIWQKGNNRDGNYGVRDSRELDEANKPSDAEDGVAGSERPSEATSTTAEEADEKHGQDTSHGAPPTKSNLTPFPYLPATAGVLHQI